MSDADLARLAEEYGVATTYEDWRGRRVPVAVDTLRHVLGSLGVDASGPRAALEAHWADQATRLLPPCVVTRAGRTPQIPLPDGSRCWVEKAGGGWAEPGPQLPLGVHTLHVEHGAVRQQAPLLVVPDRLPPVAEHGRVWGLMAQLYSVRSRASWGMGDLRDLAELADWSARDLGADFTIVNPLHATEPVTPVEPSPYLPVSRRYAGALSIRIEDIPEYAALEPTQRETIQRLARPLREHARTADLLDRDAIWEAKRTALGMLFAVPRPPAREAAFQAYLEREGASLVEFATWCALAEEHGRDYRAWPFELRDVRAHAVGTEALRRWPAVEFHRWLQWVLDEQLAAAQAGARAAGMSIGIVHDLAIGVQPGGADAWMFGDAIAPGVSVGAPPDEFNQQGQDWGQPPWHPVRLAELGYDPFRQVLGQVLRHAGGVRMDHIMGLFRLWWVPEGASPAEGTYVRYDHEGMVGSLLLAAQAHGAAVIGEDLGTVEPWVRDHLGERGVLGTSVLWFERRDDGSPRRPEEWRADCLATVATHDLPPVASYLSAEHVELRDRLGLLSRPAADERADAEAAVAAWRDRLVGLGLLDPGVDPLSEPATVVTALHAYLAQTPARLIGVALTDVVGDRRMQNQPGTSDAYPNWRIPLTSAEGEPVLLDELIADPRLAETARRVLRPLTDPAYRGPGASTDAEAGRGPGAGTGTEAGSAAGAGADSRSGEAEPGLRLSSELETGLEM
ncbi:4-alpha-glucanotransferase [Streptomonospora nanhaiensis]|uniref:4-alpha-glucanotransferase n=1 Tax=Streptomonospora nanhaiensis TaxID=1323731 RepID=A0A853BW94_9ACTN|nr:4-alpha-glucanotransferase [Streptomonospora nanhaiensis]MBV2366553.1 4-alpha-glucanotransferase [Streptomonospora nanhaiensis]MBX9388374.1 4-alpha-glucanotransferase [Streptomonospora nanhaiensis]NYI98462.1 4-alpha-glucanotransferase [Streptomonospora nanhaiensis]